MDGDPADEVGLLIRRSISCGCFANAVARVGRYHVVGGFPTEAAGDVGELGGELLSLFGVDLPAQGGLEQQAIG